MKDILDKIYNLSSNIKIIAVSKYASADQVKIAYKNGLTDFGENKIKELENKKNILNNYDITWHMIGNLQSNKINQMINLKPYLWQSCDSFKRAVQVDQRLDYSLNTLLQINSSGAKNQNGVDPDMAIEIYEQIKEFCQNINLKGVMSIGAQSDDIKTIIKSFEKTYKIYEKLGSEICSMGMSNDYEMAIKSGSNMLRLGSVLFSKSTY